MKLEEHIKELLQEYDCVLVPDFGGFVTNSCSASIDRSTHVFLPPRKEISFNVHLTRNDGLLVDRIALVESWSHAAARDKIADVVNEWKATIEKGDKIELEGIGILFQDRNRQILFEPNLLEGLLQGAFGFSSFQSPPIIRESKQQKIEKQITQPVEELAKKVSKKSKGKVIPLRRYASVAAACLLLALMVWGVTKIQLPEELPISYTELNPFKSLGDAIYTPREDIPSTQLNAITPEKDESDAWLETVYRQKEEEVVKKEKPQKINRFFVIGGCFAQYDNAERLVKKLRRKGFDAQLAGKNRRNLHRVAYGGYETRREAKRELRKIKKEQIQSAWLFVKR